MNMLMVERFIKMFGKKFWLRLASLIVAQSFASYIIGYLSMKLDWYIITSLSIVFCLGFMYSNIHDRLFFSGK